MESKRRSEDDLEDEHRHPAEVEALDHGHVGLDAVGQEQRAAGQTQRVER